MRANNRCARDLVPRRPGCSLALRLKLLAGDADHRLDEFAAFLALGPQRDLEFSDALLVNFDALFEGSVDLGEHLLEPGKLNLRQLLGAQQFFALRDQALDALALQPVNELG